MENGFWHVKIESSYINKSISVCEDEELPNILLEKFEMEYDTWQVKIEALYHREIYYRCCADEEFAWSRTPGYHALSDGSADNDGRGDLTP